MPELASSRIVILSIKNTYMNHQPLRKLSQEAVDDFKALYKEEFKEDLTDDEAYEIALRVIRFFHILVYGKSEIV